MPDKKWWITDPVCAKKNKKQSKRNVLTEDVVSGIQA
jgi:hypothetical protein